jgi:hypothetical protein
MRERIVLWLEGAASTIECAATKDAIARFWPGFIRAIPLSVPRGKSE